MAIDGITLLLKMPHALTAGHKTDHARLELEASFLLPSKMPEDAIEAAEEEKLSVLLTSCGVHR